MIHAEGGAMEQVKVILECQDCGITYRRPVESPDDAQDVRRGVSCGCCDDCWREQMCLMGGESWDGR